MIYTVLAEVTISVYTEVEAVNAEEAEEKAAERPMMTLCHQCADDRNVDQQWVTSGELDGEPMKIRVEEN